MRKGNTILRAAYISESIYTPEVGDLITKVCQYISTKGKMFIEGKLNNYFSNKFI